MFVRSLKHLNIVMIALLLLFFPFRNSSNQLLQNGNCFSNTKKSATNLHLPFIENRGQIENDDLKYYTKTFCGSLGILTTGEIVYALPRQGHQARKNNWVIHERVFNCLPLRPQAEAFTSTRLNYFKGNDPYRWQTNLRTCQKINFGEIYNGIKFQLKAHSNNVEKLFYIEPGASPEQIRIKVDGATQLAINNKGELEVVAEEGRLTFSKPVAFQEINTEQKLVEVAYQIENDQYGFTVSNYDHSYPLVIDPLLAATYLGGAGQADVPGEDAATAMVTDPAGNIFLTGWTKSTDFPTTPGAFDESYNTNGDVFVAKFSPDLNQLLAATYIGGEVGWDGSDRAYDIALDQTGNVYVVGETASSDFPVTTGVYDSTFNGAISDCFLAKFNNDLTQLLAATFLGGSSGTTGEDVARSIDFDESGNVYVTGWTAASDFPTTAGAYQPSFAGGTYDMFLAKFDHNFQNLLAATLLGGDAMEYANAVVYDRTGEVFVAGESYSGNFPTTDTAYDPTFNSESGTNSDVVVAKFDNNLEQLLAATFLGEQWSEKATALTIDPQGSVFVAGWTGSAGFPTTSNSYDPSYNEPEPAYQGFTGDGFIAKFNNSLTSLLAATFLGAEGKEQVDDIKIHLNQQVLVAGYTESAGFPVTTAAFDTSNDQGNAFISLFDKNLQHLSGSTFLGGDNGVDGANTITSDADGNIYVAGYTYAADFPTSPNAFDSTYNNDGDAFVVKFDSSLALTTQAKYTTILKYDNGNYRWRIRLGGSVDERACFVRFTLYNESFLESAMIRLSGYHHGTPDIRVIVLNQDKDLMGQVDVPFGNLTMNEWNSIDLTSLNLKVNHDFYIGVGLINPTADDTLWVNGDDGPGMNERSYIRLSRTWFDMNVDYEWDLNAMMRANIWNETGVTTQISGKRPEIFLLEQNYPNPFNLHTNIHFQLPQANKTTLKIYNTIGQEIRTLINTHLPAGVHQMQWDGCDNFGKPVGSGVYFYRLMTTEDCQIRRMILLK